MLKLVDLVVMFTFGHLASFQFGAIMNNAAMNNFVNVFL